MRIKFWGVRGSIATPGLETSFFGGNTSCVTVNAQGKSLILDAGTGIRVWGQQLTRRGRHREYHLLLSHFHTDHLAGLPFFRPLFERNTRLHLYGPKGRQPLKRVIADFLAEDFFPVPVSRIPAMLCFHHLSHRSFNIPPFKVTPFRSNHPGKALGYLIQTPKTRLAYLCDHEPIRSFSHIKGVPPSQYEKDLGEKLSDIDLLIHDSHFTDQEYPRYRGWGHSPWSYPLRLAKKYRIKQLVLFHHAPEHNDQRLKNLFEKLNRQGIKGSIHLAREGEVITL